MADNATVTEEQVVASAATSAGVTVTPEVQSAKPQISVSVKDALGISPRAEVDALVEKEKGRKGLGAPKTDGAEGVPATPKPSTATAAPTAAAPKVTKVIKKADGTTVAFNAADKTTATPAAEIAPAATGAVKTLEEVQAELDETKKKLEAATKTPAAAPAPVAQVTPAQTPTAAPSNQPTAEQLAKMVEDENKWIGDVAPMVRLQPLSTDEVEKILLGGEDAVKVMNSMRQKDIASAILSTKKVMAAEIENELSTIRAQLEPITKANEAAHVDQLRTEFDSKYPALVTYSGLRDQTATELVAKYNSSGIKPTRDEFFGALANAMVDKAKTLGFTLSLTPAQVTAPVTPAAAVATPVVKPAAARPPVATIPATAPVMPGGDNTGLNFQANTARSMRPQVPGLNI